MFTKRFIEVPVSVVDANQKELIGEYCAEKISVKCKINPFEISDYREDINNETVVTFKNGNEIVVECSFEEFENLLDAI